MVKSFNAISLVMVTFNRVALLKKSLVAQASQTLEIAKILVVDNASTDGTREMLAEAGWLNRRDVELLALPENTGGAGGFAAGLKHVIDSGAEWAWMMDDDAEPQPDALAELMKIATDPGNIYGSLAVAGDETAWEITLLDPGTGKTQRVIDIPDQADVEMLPLLGLLVHRDLVARIGFPDASFFIAGDDAEYCIRARRAGARVIVAGRSRINHPKAVAQHLSIFGKKMTYLSLPPWKRYYDTRNRLLIARKHYGVRLFTQTIPGSLIRFIAALLKEPKKLMQAYAFFAGFIDGLLGIKGRRHEKWRINP